jgi:sec-independent protein translocase protein TatB
MFDVGWSEMLVIMVIALLLFGPKDLIGFMRQASAWVRKAQGMAREFQSSIDEIAREQDIQEAKKALEQVQGANPVDLAEKLDPTGSLKEATSILNADPDRPIDAAAAASTASDVPLPTGLVEAPPLDGGTGDAGSAASWSVPPAEAGPPVPVGLVAEPPPEPSIGPAAGPPPGPAAEPAAERAAKLHGAADRPAA